MYRARFSMDSSCRGRMRGSKNTLNPECRHLSRSEIMSLVILPFARSILSTLWRNICSTALLSTVGEAENKPHNIYNNIYIYEEIGGQQMGVALVSTDTTMSPILQSSQVLITAMCLDT